MIPSNSGNHELRPNLEQHPHAAVLVVDDDSTNRLILGGLLQTHGYRTFSASNGLQALRLMASQRFWTIFIDIRMPDIDGFETIRRMRRMNNPQQSAATRVVGVSASVEKALQAKAEGFDAFLPKPVHGKDLSAVLERLIHDDMGLKQQPMILA